MLAEPKAFELEPVTISGWLDEDGNPVTSAIASPVEPPAKKQPVSKLEEHKKLFSKAWFATGADVVEDAPYISRSGLLHYLIEGEAMAAQTAETYIKPGRRGQLIEVLQSAEVIERSGAGWIVVDNVWSSSLLLRRGEKA
jgi:hypothetical protein